MCITMIQLKLTKPKDFKAKQKAKHAEKRTLLPKWQQLKKEPVIFLVLSQTQRKKISLLFKISAVVVMMMNS